MTDGGLDAWTTDLSARERVRAIATTLTEPRSVEWVRTEAHISAWQTAKDELEMLVEFGQLQRVESDGGHTQYAPHYQQRYINEVTELINTHTHIELRQAVAETQSTIDDWKREFRVDSRAELEATLTNDTLDSEDIRERNQVLREWEQYADTKRLLSHALELYEDARELQFGQSDESSSPPSLSQ